MNFEARRIVLKIVLIFVVLFSVRPPSVVHAFNSLKTDPDFKLRLYIGNANAGDTIILITQDRYLTDLVSFTGEDLGHLHHAVVDSSLECRFSIDQFPEYAYLSIGKGYSRSSVPKLILRNFLAARGDDISFYIDGIKTVKIGDIVKLVPAGLKFSGRGSPKYSLIHRIQEISSQTTIGDSTAAAIRETRKLMQHGDLGTHHKLVIDEGIETADSIMLRSLQLLNKARPMLSSHEYRILIADIYGDCWLRKYTTLFRFRRVAPIEEAVQEYVRPFREAFLAEVRAGIDENPIPISRSFAEAVVAYMTARCFMAGDEGTVYESLKENFHGAFKDKALTVYLLKMKLEMNDEIEGFYRDAMGVIADAYYTSLLASTFNALAQGVVATEFGLPDVEGKIVRLADFKGKIVFLDFWYTGCLGCSSYYTGLLGPIEEKYRNNKRVVFVTISIDKNKENWIAAVKSGKYTSDYVINLYTGGEGSRHQVIQDYKVYAYPRPILIDEDGRIITSDSNILRRPERLRRLLSGLLE